MPPSHPPRFSHIIALDWSGAQPARGIAVAEACCASRQVRPIPPPDRHWTRAAAADWLVARLRQGPALVGIDCAFGLPYVAAQGGYLEGRAPGVDSLTALWDLVDAASAGDADYAGRRAVDDPRLRPSYWISGPTPAHWRDGPTTRRLVERVSQQLGLGNPVSVFKLAAASKQVGKASLAGMRVLRHLRRSLGPPGAGAGQVGTGGLAVWPMEHPGVGDSAVVEIFPTLFRRRAHGLAKLRDWPAIAAGVARLGARLAPDIPLPPPDDHLGDAIIAAAGMMALCDRAEVWHPPQMDEDAARTEGWIFGVA